MTKSGVVDVKGVGGEGEKVGVMYNGLDGASGVARNLLVTGIGGGVALMALGFAVAMGVRVWVTSGDAGKIERARELGAEGGVGYREKGWEKNVSGSFLSKHLLSEKETGGGPWSREWKKEGAQVEDI